MPLAESLKATDVAASAVPVLRMIALVTSELEITRAPVALVM